MNKTDHINLPQIATLLKATPRTLRSELTPLDPKTFVWRPASDKWCINEIIGHLIDSDRRAFAGRIQTFGSRLRCTDYKFRKDIFK